MKKITDKIFLEQEIINTENNNISKQINDIINNIPDTTPLEKIRYIFIKLGNLFSYDYRVAYDSNYIYNKKTDLNNYVDKYQTCIQISSILNKIFNNIDGVESKIIERKLNLRGAYGDNHVANEVTIKIDDNYSETYILDLTLDLYLIQNKCKTKHFGFESSIDKQYDIIPQIDNYEMDKKIKYINDNYMDDIIDKYKILFNQFELNNNDDEILNFKLENINMLLKPTFGYHEGKQFLNLLFMQLLNCNYKEFNLYKKENENITNLKTFYKIEKNDLIIWIVYSNKFGIMFVDKEMINDMLNNGWETKSTSLTNEFNNKTY